MVALTAGLILIALLAVVVTLVDGARSAYWRGVALQRRLVWEQRNASATGKYVRQRP